MERSSFFNSVITNGKPDRVYLAEDFARYFASFIGNGVFPNPATNLQVVAVDGMDIAVMKGKAWINGYFYENTDSLNIKLDPADGLLNRIDRVVVRVNLNAEARNARIHLKQGKYANKPVAPSLQRDADVYEIALADIKVNKGTISIKQGDITDTRLSKELCGIVHGVVDQVDTETLFKQYESWYKETTGKADEDLKVIIENFEKDTEKYLSEYQEWFNSFTDEKDTEFNEWFDTVKDILDENVASKLYKEIEELREYVDEQVEQAGKVDSVNGKTGDVELTARDIPYDNIFSIEMELKSKAYKWDLDDKADESYVDDRIIASPSSTGIVSTSKDRSVISSDSSNATSKNSTVIASEGSKTNQTRSAVIASRNSETDGSNYSNRSGNVILASHGVKTPSGSRNLVVGGCASDTNATPSVDNIKWKLDGVAGTLWVDNDIEIGNMKVKNKLGSLSNSSTIVIANHDSHPSSKVNADILISRGENAAKKINDAIQSLQGTGGEVKLMEGNYNLEYGIAVNVDGVHLTGIPRATILVQNKAWKGNPFNNDRKHIVDTWRDGDLENVNVEITNIYVKGANISDSRGFNCLGSSKITNCISENSGSYGFYCLGSSKITNCISENSGSNGFSCYDSSKITNCISENSGKYGFFCTGSSIVTNCISENSGSDGFYCIVSPKVTNCISENSGSHGFSCYNSSKITNCISENSGSYGFFCSSPFKGVCGHNTLVGDKLIDNSSSPAIVQYNIIQEGV